MNYIERGPTDCWTWLGDPDEAPNKDARMACMNPLCCNPRHVVEQVEVITQDLPPVRALRKRLEIEGIKVDKRWGRNRLLDEIAALENGNDDSE